MIPKPNGHRIKIEAVSQDGISFTEAELRAIEDYLEHRGFRGNVYVQRIPLLDRLWFDKLGEKLYGKQQ